MLLHSAPELVIVDAPFVRLWRGFLTGRVMVALAVLVLQGVGQILNQTPEPTVLAVCVAYLAATLMLRMLGADAPPDSLGRALAAFATFPAALTSPPSA